MTDCDAHAPYRAKAQMNHRRRRRMGPLQQQRLALSIIILGAFLAGLGAYQRANSEGSGGGSGWYLLDTAGLLLVAVAAVWQARLGGILIVFDPKAVRRRAILSMLAGICTALTGCVTASKIENDASDAALRAFTEAGIVGGIGLGLAGFLTLAWAFGMGYAGDRINRLSEEDW